MPEMSNAFIPEHKGEKEPREKILKLGKKNYRLSSSQITWSYY